MFSSFKKTELNHISTEITSASNVAAYKSKIDNLMEPLEPLFIPRLWGKGDFSPAMILSGGFSCGIKTKKVLVIFFEILTWHF